MGCVSSEFYNAAGANEYRMRAPELVPKSSCLANQWANFWVTEGNLTRHYTEAEALSYSLVAGKIRVAGFF